MALIEVEESAVKALSAINAEVQAMLADPKVRPEFLKAYKAKFPGVAIPEIDARAPVDAAVAELRKELADEKAARAKEREDEETKRKAGEFTAWREKGHSLLRSRGVTEKGIEAVEKLMQGRGLSDFEAAFATWRMNEPPEAPIESKAYSPSFGMRSLTRQSADDDVKLLFKGGKAHAGEEFARQKTAEFFANRDAERARRL